MQLAAAVGGPQLHPRSSMSKEALVFVLDVGHSMWSTAADNGDEGNVKGVTLLDKAIKCLSLMISQKIMDARKTDQVALVLAGTDGTDNPLASDSDYEHVSVAFGFGSARFELIKYLQEAVPVGERGAADPVDAVVVAADMLIELTKGKAYGVKRIIFMSDFGGAVNANGIEEIKDRLAGQGLSLDLVTLDGDDTGSVALLKEQLVDPLDGAVFGIDEALGMLAEFGAKRTRQVATFKGTLDLGKTGDGGHGLQIPVAIYSKTMPGKVPTAKKLIDGSSTVERSLEYRTVGAEDPSVVSKDDLIKAYRYGKTLVPFHRIDEAQMGYEAEKGLAVLAFVPAASLPHHLFMSNVWEVVGEAGNETALLAMAAFAQGLYEKDAAALGRYVRAQGGAPRLVALLPSIAADHVGLQMVALPFAEDLRRYTFPSLDKMPASLRPNDSQREAMRAWIEAMTVKAPEDEDEESIVPDSSNVHNPAYQRLLQCILARVQDPASPIQTDDSSHLLRHLQTPPELQEEAAAAFARVKELFELKPVQKWKHAEIIRFWSADGTAVVAVDEAVVDATEAEEPLKEGEDRRAGPHIVRIAAETPLDDFKAMISDRHHDLVVPAFKQLMALIPSFAKAEPDRAVECFQALRQAALSEDEPDMFNAYLQELKRLRHLSPDDFPAELWAKLAGASCTLISRAEHPESLVSPEHAADFFIN